MRSRRMPSRSATASCSVSIRAPSSSVSSASSCSPLPRDRSRSSPAVLGVALVLAMASRVTLARLAIRVVAPGPRLHRPDGASRPRHGAGHPSPRHARPRMAGHRAGAEERRPPGRAGQAAASCALLLVLCTPWTHVLKALRLFGMPPVLIVILGMTHRYIFVLLRTAVAMIEARRARTVGRMTGGTAAGWRRQAPECSSQGPLR